MAKWQPPIPSGALWCKPMRELGPAKALIEYCYDIVDRDGWCRFKLVEVADAMDEPYINVKRWWKAVQASNEIIGILLMSRIAASVVSSCNLLPSGSIGAFFGAEQKQGQNQPRLKKYQL